MIGKDKQASLRLGLIAATVLFGSLVGAKVAQSVIEPRRVEQLVADAAARNDADPNGAEASLASARQVVQTLREKNLFVKAPPKQHPVKQVDGILGREVLVGNKWYGAGDKIGDANVISVGSTHAIIEWEGRKKTFAPIAAAGASPGESSQRPAPKRREARMDSAEPAPKAGSEAVTVTTIESVEEDPLAWLGIDLPPHVKAKLLEMWNSMPQEQKESVKEEWNNMSDAQRQEAIREFEEENM
ncbi:MAG: hypothetical protein JSW27_19200 [Phycisphaerales bacterium]|nr:MAG: hypothetical protein JSW27_19200 [Phycisphaerales bacterium]